MKNSFSHIATLAVAALALAAAAVQPAVAEEIGSVNTEFKLIGPDHKIVVEVFDDPKVQGISCYVSRARKGGVYGALGIATEKTEASIACRQVGDIVFKEAVPQQEDVFTERMSVLFKTMHIVRMADPKRHVLIYLTYSDKLLDGSPKNSVTAVPVGNVQMRMR